LREIQFDDPFFSRIIISCIKIRENMKWVTKQNMVWWIILGICIVVFGIFMGMWKDKKTIEKMTEEETDKNKNIDSEIREMINILIESYKSEQKIQNISQLDALKEDSFSEYRIIINDQNITVDDKVDKLKRKVAFRYYLANSSLEPTTKVQNLTALQFSEEKSTDITDALKSSQNAQDKIDTIYAILKQDL
jgi:uncharacterized protein YneF (UPF0154 family)